MTNEELAIKAKDGDQNAIIELWEQVRKYAEMKAGQFFRWHSSNRAPCFENDDLVQSAFLALTKAIRYSDPEKAPFLTIYDFCLRTAFADVAGQRNKADAFLYASSLDTPIGDGEEGDLSALIDFIPDQSIGLEDAVLHDLWITQLHDRLEAAMDALPEDQREVLNRHYYHGETFQAIGDAMSCTGSAAQQKESKALGHLRAQSRILGLDEFIDARTNYYLKVGIGEFSRTNTSAVEKLVFEREERRERLARRWFAKRRRKESDISFEDDTKRSAECL